MYFQYLYNNFQKSVKRLFSKMRFMGIGNLFLYPVINISEMKRKLFYDKKIQQITKRLFFKYTIMQYIYMVPPWLDYDDY